MSHTKEHLSNALTWIERHVPSGIALVARALSETYPASRAAGSSAPLSPDEPTAFINAGGVPTEHLAEFIRQHQRREGGTEGHADDPGAWEVYEDLRSRYASACERMGMAHANGTRAEWEDAARSEIERRLALNAQVRSLTSRGGGSRKDGGK